MTSITLGQNPAYLHLNGMVEDHPWVAVVYYNNGEPWPAEPSLVFANGDVWLPVAEDDSRVWNIPAEAVNRVLTLDSHLAEFYLGDSLHSRSLDAF